MEFLGIGPLELLLIVVILLLIMGPDDMVKAGMTVGRFIRNIKTSDVWRSFQRARRSLRTLPEDLARQAGLEELREEVARGADLDLNPDPDGMEAWMRMPSEDELTRPDEKDGSSEEKTPPPSEPPEPGQET